MDLGLVHNDWVVVVPHEGYEPVLLRVWELRFGEENGLEWGIVFWEKRIT